MPGADKNTKLITNNGLVNSLAPTAAPTGTPSGSPSPSPSPSPTATPDPGTSTPCPGTSGVLCKGGFGAGGSGNKEIPAKIIFLNPAGTKLTQNAQQMAVQIIDKANNQLLFEGHQHLKFKLELAVELPEPSIATIQNASAMTAQYGSTEHYVLVLVNDIPGGTAGYSPGLRIDWKSKQSIVVMEYRLVANGVTVLVHELLHGMGAPHTTDGNGGQDNVFPHGIQKYSSIVGNNPPLKYNFDIFLEDAMSYEGVRSAGGFNWDTRTIMMWYVTNYPLFKPNSDSAMNGAYSNVLNEYYLRFVK
jgi:hypothetical protein